MKTITMDYQTYQDELLKAKKEGSQLTNSLKEAMKNYMDAYEGYGQSRDSIYKLRKHVLTMIAEIETVDV